MYIIAQQQSGKETITVYETNELYGEIGRFRVLSFHEQAVQGVIDLRQPERMVLEYPRAMSAFMEHHAPDFKKAFLIGYGTGTLVRRFAQKEMIAADIHPHVVALSRQYFYESPQSVHVGDGRIILEQQEPCSFDFVLLDAFTAAGTPHHLTTVEFFMMVKEKLTGRGALIMNAIGIPEKDYRIQSIAATLAYVFPYTATFALEASNPIMLQNIIMVGSYVPLLEPDKDRMAGFEPIDLILGMELWDR